MQIAYETVQFIVPSKHLMKGVSLSFGGTDPPFSFLAVVHVGLWVIIFITDRVLQHLHHQSQAKGYLEFFRETKELRRLPHAILSIGIDDHFVSFFSSMRFNCFCTSLLRTQIHMPHHAWACALSNKLNNVRQAFWQGARVRDRTIRSNPHNNAQFLKIHKIPHNSEISSQKSIQNRYFYQVLRFLECF